MIIGCLLAVHAQSETITVNANSTELANDLDLKAIATAFGDASSVEDFEEKLNDQSLGLSNLDLNNDGEVDYLRCIETESAGNSRHILIQAVLATDIYQDIANISVDKDETGTITTKVYGNAYVYGQTYIITPTYIYRPAIYNWLWCDHYRYWRSPYYWGYWPHYYRHHPYCYHDVYHRRMHDYHRHHPVSFDKPRPPMGNNKPMARPTTPSNRRIESTQHPTVDHRQTVTQPRTSTRSTSVSTRASHPVRTATQSVQTTTRSTRTSTQSVQNTNGTRNQSVRTTQPVSRYNTNQMNTMNRSVSTRTSTRTNSNVQSTSRNASNVSNRSQRSTPVVNSTTRRSSAPAGQMRQPAQQQVRQSGSTRR